MNSDPTTNRIQFCALLFIRSVLEVGDTNKFNPLTLILLTLRIWWAPNNASKWPMGFNSAFRGLNAELNPIWHLLVLLGAHYILHFSRIRVKVCAVMALANGLNYCACKFLTTWVGRGKGDVPLNWRSARDRSEGQGKFHEGPERE